MDMSMMVQPVVSWIETQFGDQDMVSKNELMQKAQGSNLPQDAKDGLSQLPEGRWSKGELIGKVRDMFSAKAGMGSMGGMGGMGGTGGMGDMGGTGGYGGGGYEKR